MTDAYRRDVPTFTAPIVLRTGALQRKQCGARCTMKATTAAPSVLSEAMSSAVTAALSVPAVRHVVMAAGRRKILADAERIGVDWEGDVSTLRAEIISKLEPFRVTLEDDTLQLPEYYLVPFHAYKNGNLGWQPALEAEVSSLTVHSQYPEVPPLQGDAWLRNNALRILADRWEASSPDGAPETVLDIGCSVGLSSILLKQRWPSARVVGVDPSAEMLAVGKLRRPDVEYVHALGEALPMEFEGTFDIVTIQLVVHELPDHAMRSIFAEAYRVLRMGGMLAVMDVDPAAFDKVLPVIVALFQSTEPYFEQHKQRDVGQEMELARFFRVEHDWNTPRHRTFTGFKH